MAENGVFLSGSRSGVVSNLRFSNVSLAFKRWTEYGGGLADYRPGCQGFVKHGMAGMTMEHIEGLEFENVDMKWSDDRSLKWNNPLDFRPSTVNNISFFNFHSGLLTYSTEWGFCGLLEFWILKSCVYIFFPSFFVKTWLFCNKSFNFHLLQNDYYSLHEWPEKNKTLLNVRFKM